MLEIKVDIRFPDLPVILEVVKSLTGRAAAVPAPIPVPADVPAPAEAPAPAPAEAPVAAPAAPVSAPGPTPVFTPRAPVAAPVSAPGPTPVFTPRAPVAAPVAPTAAPAVTLAQVAKAGADLLTADASLQPRLLELLQSFGASTVRDLPQDKLSDFAQSLRGLGAKI